MKKLFFGLIVTMFMMGNSFAYTFWANGMLYGTVCRDGVFFTVYPTRMAKPVGTSCPVRDYNGMIIRWGFVTRE